MLGLRRWSLLSGWQPGFAWTVGRGVGMVDAVAGYYSWDPEAGYFSYVRYDDAENCAGILRYENGVNFNMGLDGASPLLAGICTPEQKGAVELVSQNAGFIGDLKEKAGSEGGGGMLDMLKQMANTKVVNAELYVL